MARVWQAGKNCHNENLGVQTGARGCKIPRDESDGCIDRTQSWTNEVIHLNCEHPSLKIKLGGRGFWRRNCFDFCFMDGSQIREKWNNKNKIKFLLALFNWVINCVLRSWIWHVSLRYSYVICYRLINNLITLIKELVLHLSHINSKIFEIIWVF